MAEAPIYPMLILLSRMEKFLQLEQVQPDPELIGDHTEVKSCEGKVATPGLIGSPYPPGSGGSREHEFASAPAVFLRHPRPRRWNYTARDNEAFDNLMTSPNDC